MIDISTQYQDLPLSNFPDSNDVFKTYLDILASDGPIIKDYINAVNSGNQDLANQILRTIPSVYQKLITAQDLNQAMQAILALERFYGTDVQPYIENKQSEWQLVVDRLKYIGIFDIGTQYEKNNIVLYSVNGVPYLFIAISKPPVGTVPTNQESWRQLTIQGIQGDSGSGLSFRGEYNPSVQYSVNNAVVYGGALYANIQASQGIEPTNSTYWKRVLRIAPVTYPISDIEPVGQETGDLWFDTSVTIA